MYKEILQGIDNIEIWPVLSFVIFFLFFFLLLWWVFTRDKHFIEEMKTLPLQDGCVKSDTHPKPVKP